MSDDPRLATAEAAIKRSWAYPREKETAWTRVLAKEILVAIDAVDPMRQPLTDEVIEAAAKAYYDGGLTWRNSIRAAIEAADAARIKPKRDPLDVATDVFKTVAIPDDVTYLDATRYQLKAAIEAYNREVGE